MSLGLESRATLPCLGKPWARNKKNFRPEMIEGFLFTIWKCRNFARHVPNDGFFVLDQVLTNGPHSGLGAVANADLSQDVLDVLFDRFVADAQHLGDFFVG